MVDGPRGKMIPRTGSDGNDEQDWNESHGRAEEMNAPLYRTDPSRN